MSNSSGKKENSPDKSSQKANSQKDVSAFQEQLNAWREQVEKLRTLAYSANASVQAEMNEVIAELDKRLLTANETLLAYLEAGDDVVEATRHSVEDFWTGLKLAVGNALSNFSSDEKDPKEASPESNTHTQAHKKAS